MVYRLRIHKFVDFLGELQKVGSSAIKAAAQVPEQSRSTKVLLFIKKLHNLSNVVHSTYDYIAKPANDNKISWTTRKLQIINR